MIVRCTAKVSQLLKLGRLADIPAGADDWYVNVITVARRRVVVAVHADTLFPVVAVGASSTQLRDLPGWLAAQVTAALADEGLPLTQLGSLGSEHAVLARTASKKVLGHLNQIAFEVEHAVLSGGGWEGLDVLELNRWLRRSLRSREGTYVVPLELAEQRVVNPANDAFLAQFKAGLQGVDPDQLRELTGALLGLAGAGTESHVQTALLAASIRDAEPPITRDLEVPVSLTLEQLHHLLQRALGWTDSHLYRFAAGDNPWEGELYLCDFDINEADDDLPGGAPLRATRVREVFDQVDDELLYLYDYGDHWEVTLTLTAWGEGPRDRAAITGGEGQAPPDDSGGIHTWNEERPDDSDFRVAVKSVPVRSLRRPVRR